MFSRLFYCSSICASTTKTNISRIKKVQNFAARIVTEAIRYDYITPMLKELHWLPVTKQLDVRDVVMAFRCIKGPAPPALCNKFTARSQVHSRNTRSKRNTRNKDKFNVQLFKTATGNDHLLIRAACILNSLPECSTSRDSLIFDRYIFNFIHRFVTTNLFIKCL